MRKKLFAMLGLSCIIAVLLVACGSDSNGPNPVHMNAGNFVQNSITIKKGESITLINDNLFVAHTIANGTWENSTTHTAREASAPEINDVKIDGNSSATVGPFREGRAAPRGAAAGRKLCGKLSVSVYPR